MTRAAPANLAAEDEWIRDLDLDGFGADIKELGKSLQAGQGAADLAHLNKIVNWTRICLALGGLSLWCSPNPFTVFFLSTAICARWLCIGHHVGHGSYDSIDKSKYYNRFTFAVGSLPKRMWDWLDWMLPEAWNVEHNLLHHYALGENKDPDLLERNMDRIRNLKVPTCFKYLVVAFIMFTWKFTYYAPNTYKELKISQLRRQKKPLPSLQLLDGPVLLHGVFFPGTDLGVPPLFGRWEYFTKVMGPYLARFILFPGAFWLLGGATFFWNALANMVLAEMCTNIHTFIINVPNHAGDDLYRFETSCKFNSPTFFLRQVISSANFATGGDLNDFMHGWMNYQVEHHLWPNLSMLSYQRAQPLVKKICFKHGVPYIQQSVFRRLWKTIQIVVGTASMRRYPTSQE